MRSRRFKFAGLSTLAIRLASFLGLDDGLPTISSVMVVLEARMALVRMTVSAFRFASVQVEQFANLNALDVRNEVAVRVL